MLQKDADFLRNHMTDEDSNGEVIARLESRGCSDSCDSCDLEIFNGFFFLYGMWTHGVSQMWIKQEQMQSDRDEGAAPQGSCGGSQRYSR